MPKKSGFTLVELLVVIAIISILAIIGMVSYIGVQKGARDAKRRADVNSITDVLEAHYNDTASPCSATAIMPYCASVSDTFFSGGRPHAPSGTDYSIKIPAERTSYTVCADLENNNGNSSDAGTDTDPADFTLITDGTGGFYCRRNQQ